MLATLSRWRPSVQIRPGTLNKMARYANRQSGEAQTFVIVCGFDSLPCYFNIMAQWTSGCGRHALTVEIAGSNPAWVTLTGRRLKTEG